MLIVFWLLYCRILLVNSYTIPTDRDCQLYDIRSGTRLFYTTSFNGFVTNGPTLSFDYKLCKFDGSLYFTFFRAKLTN